MLSRVHFPAFTACTLRELCWRSLSSESRTCPRKFPLFWRPGNTSRPACPSRTPYRPTPACTGARCKWPSRTRLAWPWMLPVSKKPKSIPTKRRHVSRYTETNIFTNLRVPHFARYDVQTLFDCAVYSENEFHTKIVSHI